MNSIGNLDGTITIPYFVVFYSLLFHTKHSASFFGIKILFGSHCLKNDITIGRDVSFSFNNV